MRGAPAAGAATAPGVVGAAIEAAPVVAVATAVGLAVCIASPSTAEDLLVRAGILDDYAYPKDNEQMVEMPDFSRCPPSGKFNEEYARKRQQCEAMGPDRRGLCLDHLLKWARRCNMGF